MNKRSFHQEFVVRSTGTHSPKGTGEPLDIVCSSRQLAEETYTRFTSMFTSEEGFSAAGQFKAENVFLIVRGVVVKKSAAKVLALAA